MATQRNTETTRLDQEDKTCRIMLHRLSKCKSDCMSASCQMCIGLGLQQIMPDSLAQISSKRKHCARGHSYLPIIMQTKSSQPSSSRYPKLHFAERHAMNSCGSPAQGLQSSWENVTKTAINQNQGTYECLAFRICVNAMQNRVAQISMTRSSLQNALRLFLSL